MEEAKKPPFSAALATMFLLMVVGLPVRAQGQNDEYTRQLNLAHSYEQERRYEDALGALRKAYDMKPGSELLAEMGSDFQALGMGTEAEDVLVQALKQGGEVRFDLLHRHSFGQCTGSLILSTHQVRWVGRGKKDGFEASPGETDDVRKWDSSVSENGTELQFTLPMLRFRAAKKGWNYELLLHGQRAKYHTFLYGLDTYVAYNEPELTNAGKATELIAHLLQRLPSLSEQTANAQPVATSDSPTSASSSDSNRVGRRHEETSSDVLLTEGVVVACNVPSISGEIRLAAESLAGIFLGKITFWNDPVIARINPDLNLPNQPIIVVHRSDDSDTTLIFTDYLSKVSPEWQSAPGKGTSVKWPIGLGGKGNQGVAQTIRQLSGSIGYLELNHADSKNISIAKLISANTPGESSATQSPTPIQSEGRGNEKLSADLKEGQTPQEVEKLLGRPSDTMTLKGSLIYIYPTVKVIFENGKLVDVQYQQK